MNKITKEQESIARNNFEEFLKKYENLYPKDAIEYIKQSFLSTSFEKGMIVDIVSQVYAATGVYDFVDNLYDFNIREINNTYGIDKDILEVGCGFYPGFAERVSNMQTSGSITVMDPIVLPSSLGKITIEKQTFTKETNIKKYKLVVGILPCDATIPMIENANKNDKDLYIMLCGCTHFPNLPFYYQISLNDWYQEVQARVKESLPRNREYTFYQPDGALYPIIKTYKNK